MGRQYKNSLALHTATMAYVAREFLNRDLAGYSKTETFTVPAADSEGRHRWQLDHAILDQTTITITVGGAARTDVQYGATPSAGDVGILKSWGLLEFPADDEGLSCTCAYTAINTPALSEFFNQIQVELAAAQAAILLQPPAMLTTCVASPDPACTVLPAQAAIRVPDVGTHMTIARVSVVARQSGLGASGSLTQLLVTTADTVAGADGTNSVVLPLLTCTGAETDWRASEEAALTVETPEWLNVFCLRNDGRHQDVEITLEVTFS